MKNRNVSQVPEQDKKNPTPAENGAFVDTEKFQEQENQESKKERIKNDVAQRLNYGVQ